MTVRTVKTVCSHDCPDACSVLVSVTPIDRAAADGPAESLRFAGDPEHPFTRGFLCGKVSAYEEVVDAPDRVLTPLRRTGPKGSGGFERIGWEEALREIAARIEDARRQFGGESLALYYYGGTMGTVNRYAPQALFHRLGATQLRANICFHGAEAGYTAVVGGGYGVDPEDAVHSDLIVAWGSNFVTTQVHLVPFVNEARAGNGDAHPKARLLSIDPYRCRTARAADEWIPIRPGTDAHLALALIHVLARDGLLAEDFIAERTIGFERLREEVLPKHTPAAASERTGIPAERIERLAHELAAARAPLLKIGIALGRSPRGGSSVRAVTALAGALGAWRERGGGMLYDTGAEFRMRMDHIRRPDWLERPTRVLNMTDLAVALDAARDPRAASRAVRPAPASATPVDWTAPPIRFLYVHGSNPVATAPCGDRLVRGLSREDLFTVVHERFLTDTARYADIVLPAPTFAEYADLYKSYGHLYLQFGARAIAPRGECRTNLEVVQGLARALGIEDPWFELSVEDHVRALLDTDHPNFAGIDPDRVLAGEPFRLRVPQGRSAYLDGFPTPSGKLEFVSETLASAGLPAVVDAAPDGALEDSADYPLRLVTPPAHAFLNASFGATERSRRREGGAPRLLVHPQDAAAEELAGGDTAILASTEGEIDIRVEVSPDVQPGTVIVEGTWWPSHSLGGRGINALATNVLSDLGEGAAFHDLPVRLRARR